MVLAVLNLSDLVHQSNKAVPALCPSIAQLEPKQMLTLGGTAHQHAQSCCPPWARVLPALAAGHELPSSPPLPCYQQPQKGWKEGGRSCSGAADQGKSGCQAVLGVPLCGDTHRSCHRCSAVGLVCQVSPALQTLRETQINGFLPRVGGMHAWQRDWVGGFFSVLPGWRKESQDQHPVFTCSNQSSPFFISGLARFWKQDCVRKYELS